MADLENLELYPITEMDTDEAIELLRQIRLSRRIPDKKRKASTKKQKSTREMNANEAANILRILEGK